MSEMTLLYAMVWGAFWAVAGGAIGARKGQGASGIVWSLLLGPIGILIVLMLPDLDKQDAGAAAAASSRAEEDRRSRLKASGLICPSCNHELAAKSRFCPSCGASMVPAKCGGCEATLKPGAKFCPECGTPASKAKAVEAMVCGKCEADLPAGAIYCVKCGEPASKGKAKRDPKDTPRREPEGEEEAGSQALADRLPVRQSREAAAHVALPEPESNPALVIGVTLLVVAGLGGGVVYYKASKDGEIRRLHADFEADVYKLIESELSYSAAFGKYVTSDWWPCAPEDLDPRGTNWSSGSPLDEIGFDPKAFRTQRRIAGTYRVEVETIGSIEMLTVYAEIDADNDGRTALYMGHDSGRVSRITPDDVW